MNYGTLVVEVAAQMVGGCAVIFVVGFCFDYVRSMWFPR